MKQYWIAVASREHVMRGATGNFMQVCHGKLTPLRRIKPGDLVVYYSPVELFGQKEPCRRFTAIGEVCNKEPYQYEMSSDFIPWRRDVAFVRAEEASIEPLIDNLSFIKNKQRWGFPFRRGCFTVSFDDFCYIASQMGVDIT